MSFVRASSLYDVRTETRYPHPAVLLSNLEEDIEEINEDGRLIFVSGAAIGAWVASDEPREVRP